MHSRQPAREKLVFVRSKQGAVVPLGRQRVLALPAEQNLCHPRKVTFGVARASGPLAALVRKGIRNPKSFTLDTLSKRWPVLYITPML